MDENLVIWNSVCETDPAVTKRVNQRGGFTAIDAIAQVKNATKKFGPIGKGWGYSVHDVQYPPNETIIVTIRLWHGERENYFDHGGQAELNTKYGPDKDCYKKAITDGVTKCLSMLGFNADVFEGKFDDNKYVETMKEKSKAKPIYVDPPPHDNPQDWITERMNNLEMFLDSKRPTIANYEKRCAKIESNSTFVNVSDGDKEVYFHLKDTLHDKLKDKLQAKLQEKMKNE